MDPQVNYEHTASSSTSPVGVLSLIGQALYSRLNVADEVLTCLITAIKKVAPVSLAERSEQVVNFTKFNEMGTFAISSSFRVKHDDSNKVKCNNFLKFQYSPKINGAYSKAKDLRGIELSFDMSIRLLKFLQSGSNTLNLRSNGFQGGNHADLEFVRHDQDISVRIDADEASLRFVLDLGDILDLKVTIFSVLKIRYYYLDDASIMALMNTQAPQAINSSYAAIKDEVESVLFGIDGVVNEMKYKTWLRNKCPGLGMQQNTKKAVWAIANQKLKDQDKDMESVTWLQQNSSDEFGRQLIDLVNNGSLEEFTRIVNWRKHVRSG